MEQDDFDDEKRGGKRSRDERAAFKPVPPARKELPPELAAFSDEELRDACESLFAITVKILRSRERAKQLYLDVLKKLVTTRRYDPTRGPLMPWLILVAKSEYSNAWQKDANAEERDALAHEGFHREEQPVVTDSIEDQILNRAEAERRRAAAAKLIGALHARFAARPLELEVIRLKGEGIEKPADIAAELGIDVTKAYVAVRAVKDALVQLMKAHAAAGPAHPDDPTDEKT